jgi:hypothetical protein
MARPSSATVGNLILFVLIGAGLAPVARATPATDVPSVRLEWTAPAECIDGDALAAAVSGQLGRPAFAPDLDAELVARGRVEKRDRGRHRAEIALATRGGEPLGVRALESDNNDCRSLDEALAVTLAIVLNVHRADVPALAREAPPPPPSAPRWRPRAGAGAGVVFGLLPGPGIEAVVSAGLMRGGRLEPGIDLAWDFAGDAAAAEGRIHVQAASARLAIAPVLLGRPRVDLRLRVSAGAGPMWASASGFAEVFTQTRLVADGRIGLQVGLRAAGPLWIQVGGEVGWLPIRPAFDVRNADGTVETLFKPQPVMGTVGVGLALRAR